MPETIKQTQLFRFDQMAAQVKDKVEPGEADVDRYVGLEHIDPESLEIRRWGAPSDVESSKILFRSGDIIFGKRRAYQRKLAVAGFDGICSAHAMVLRPKTNVVLEAFLPFFMQSDIFMDRAVKISVGGLSPTINWRDLAREEFALPPLEEQRRIAEVLGAIEAALNSNLEARVQLRVAGIATIDGWMDALRKQGRPSVSLSALAVKKPSYGLNAPATEYQESLPRYLRITDIDDDGNLSNDGLVSVEVDDPDSYRIKCGDLLFARTGNTVGKAYLANGSEGNIVYAGYLIRFSLNTEVVNPSYIFAYTRSSQYWSWVRGTSRVGAQPNINAKEYGEMSLWLPETRSAQEELVRRVGAVQAAQHALEDRLAGLNALKKKVIASVDLEASADV